jgi:hypothetical protein
MSTLKKAYPIDYSADVRGGPYKRAGDDLTDDQRSEWQNRLDRGEVDIDFEGGESPYNAVLKHGTARVLAELDPPPEG